MGIFSSVCQGSFFFHCRGVYGNEHSKHYVVSVNGDLF